MFLDVEKIIEPNRNKVMFGVEVEMFLGHGNRMATNDFASLAIQRLLKRTQNTPFSKRIYKDYYSQQIELKTNPHTDAQALIADLKESYREAKQTLESLNDDIQDVFRISNFDKVNIIPASFLSATDIFCGVHIHATKVGETGAKPLHNLFANSYPLVLPIAELSQCSPRSDLISFRQSTDRFSHFVNDNSIISPDIFYNMSDGGRNRNWDFIINTHRPEREDDRHRTKNVDTLECRLFDTPWSFKYLADVITFYTNALGGVKPFSQKFTGNKMAEYIQRLARSRRWVTQHTSSTDSVRNSVFGCSNEQLLGQMNEIFGTKCETKSIPIRHEVFDNVNMNQIRKISNNYRWF